MRDHEIETTPTSTDSRTVVHHREINSRIERFQHRLRGVLVLEGSAALLAVCLGLILVLFGLDNLLWFPPSLRVALLVLALVTIGALALHGLVLRPLRRLDDDEYARLLERRCPQLESHLSNTVSFDRTHHRERRAGFEGTVLRILERETVARLQNVSSARGLVSLRRLSRLALAAGLTGVLVCVYAMTLPEHFGNAFRRFAQPLSHVSPLSRTILHVTPGDAVLLPDEDLEILATVEGELPEEVVLELEDGLSLPMAFDGRVFAYRLESPPSGFCYRITGGDYASELFEVIVERPPEVKTLDVIVRPPAYTGQPERVERDSTGNVSALRGSEIALEIQTTLPVSRASVVFGEPADRTQSLTAESPDRLTTTMTLEEDVDYDFVFVGTDGVASPSRPLSRRLGALVDAPPACQILQPRDGDDWNGSPSLPITLALSDDVGLRDAVILASAAARANGAGVETTERRAPGTGELSEPWSPVATLEGFAGETDVVPSVLLDVSLAREQASALGAEDGEDASPRVPRELFIRARCTDLLGQETFSRVIRLRQLDDAERRSRLRGELERARATLADVLRRERRLYDDTREVGPGMEQAVESYGKRTGELSRVQVGIRDVALGVLSTWSEQWISRDTRAARGDVTRVVRDLMPAVAADLEHLGLVDASSRSGYFEAALRGERRIIAVLSRALAMIDAALEEDPRDRGDAEGARPPRFRRTGDKLQELLSDIREFAREQSDVISRTRELESIEPEDFTADEKSAIEELAAIEENWGKFLEEKGTDLSKVAPQDMSLGSLAEEIVELVEEIDLAKDYLEGKNIELAVPAEQAGVALAEEIETDIERWLLRDRDRLKWVMEQPVGEFDVPLADLPSELEDIVGELVDQEELMTDETEDITSSWLDSMDDGIGWDAMDGPISNMSAKGVTGNLQPNDMEIGGRSGEGRSGKSQGQFVEETATGKGGRQTPTRSTPDPFESGEVKDSGKDPTGGSTGGGKLAGAGEQGLRGQPSPELERRLQALRGQQHRIRQQAERVDAALRRRRYYPQNLDRAIALMRRMEEKLAGSTPYRYDTLRRQIVAELEATEDLLAAQIDHRLHETLASPPRLDEELLNASGEEVPSEYRELLRDYYRALAEGDGRGRKEP